MRLEVYDPAGSFRPYYTGPLLLRPGQTRAEAAFSPALSDPTGDWTLKAVELSSGKTVERKLLVGPWLLLHKAGKDSKNVGERRRQGGGGEIPTSQNVSAAMPFSP